MNNQISPQALIEDIEWKKVIIIPDCRLQLAEKIPGETSKEIRANVRSLLNSLHDIEEIMYEEQKKLFMLTGKL